MQKNVCVCTHSHVRSLVKVEEPNFSPQLFCRLDLLGLPKASTFSKSFHLQLQIDLTLS